MDYWNFALLVGAALLLVSIVASDISSRMGAPLLLVFLGLGMLAGEDGPGGIRFDDFEAAYVIGTLALAIIIFDGGLRTRRETFRVGLRPALSLATLGVLATAGLVGAFAAWVFDLGWFQGLLVGAIIGSTDAAAVFALLRTQGAALRPRVAATLEIESGSNDPMAIFLTVALLELMVAGRGTIDASVLLLFAKQFGIGAIGGLAGGRLLVWLINRLRLITGLYPLLAAAGGLVLFALTVELGGSGFLAIYLAGVVLGNSRMQAGQNILRVHDGLAWLSQIVMFLILGLLLTPSELLGVAGPALGIAAFLMFVARPIAVVLSLLPFRYPWREQLYIGWVGLRGAVPVVLALFPFMYGVEGSRLYFNVAFFVVMVSLLLQGWTIAPAARWLGLEVPPQLEPAQRVTLDIPGHYDHELLCYEALEGSAVIGREAAQLKLPGDCQVVAAIRNGAPQRLGAGLRFAPGDYLYFLALPEHTEQLGQLLDPHRAPAHLEEHRYFGDFTLNGDALVGDVGNAYGVEVPPGTSAESLHGYISRVFHGRAGVGDVVPLGPAMLVVREIAGNRIVRVGLRLPRDSRPEEA